MLRALKQPFWMKGNCWLYLQSWNSSRWHYSWSMFDIKPSLICQPKPLSTTQQVLLFQRATGWKCVGKSSIGLEGLAALRLILTVQSVEEGKKNSPKDAVCHSSWAYPHHPSLQPIMVLQFNWLGTRICLFKTTIILLQPLQKSKSLLCECWANAARLFQKGIVWGKSSR